MISKSGSSLCYSCTNLPPLVSEDMDVNGAGISFIHNAKKYILLPDILLLFYTTKIKDDKRKKKKDKNKT